MAISTPDICIAAAQSASVAGDVPANVATHLRFAKAAATHGVQFLVFPELSLTGYELGIAPQHVLHADHDALAPLRAFAEQAQMSIAVGAPVAAPNGQLRIGAILFQPDGTATHTKVHVHWSETPPFIAGPGGAPYTIAGLLIGLAICADASHPEHAAKAASAGAQLYAVSVFIEEDAHARKTALIEGYARQHRIAALMANYAGLTGGAPSSGKSSIWDATGHVITAAPDNEEALVIATRRDGHWKGITIPC